VYTCGCARIGEYVAANSALEEVYGVLRASYSDVVEPDRRNDSGHAPRNYVDDDDDVWRILDVPRVTCPFRPRRIQSDPVQRPSTAVEPSV